MSRQNNNSPVPQEADQGLIQNIDIVNNNDVVNNNMANGGNGRETDSHAYSAE